jgi:hypothetical protein
MKTTKLLSLLLGAAGLLLDPGFARAASTIYNDGDVFLGFRATSGTGSAQDYLVNLGPASQFKTGGGFVLNVGDIGADLTAVFGSDWYTRIDPDTETNAVLYAVVGAQSFDAGTGDPDNTIYASNIDAIAWPRGSNSGQSVISGAIYAMGFAYSGNDSTTNSDVAIIQNAFSDNSYASYMPGGANFILLGNCFGGFDPLKFEGKPSQILYLDRMIPEFPAGDPGETLGWVQISSDGTATFQPASVPTPTPSPTPSATPTPTASPTPSGTPTPSPSASPSPSPSASPSPSPGSTATVLGNVSTRLAVGTADNVLIGGFIITGTDFKKVIVRAIGPSIPLAGVLADPSLDLFSSSGQLLVSNDNWMDAPNRQDIIDSTIAPTNDLESAVLMELSPGAYTAIVRGVSNTTGIALVEAYDLDSAVDSKLANISTRGLVQTGDNVMIGGFIMLGANAQEVLVRAIGPSLPLAGSLADPMLELHDANGLLLASNDNWRDTQEAEIAATGIPPPNDAESAILETLAPAAYTAIVRGKNETTGLALVEIYALGP